MTRTTPPTGTEYGYATINQLRKIVFEYFKVRTINEDRGPNKDSAGGTTGSGIVGDGGSKGSEGDGDDT